MRHLRVNWATIALTVLVLALLGVVAGFVWSAVAPATRYVMLQAGPQLADPETQTLIQADGWFAAVTGAFGLISGVAAYVLLSRGRPVEALLGLASGGLLASYVAFLVGRTAKGTAHVPGPGGFPATASLTLTAYGVLFAWPLLATAVFWAVEFVATYRHRRA